MKYLIHSFNLNGILTYIYKNTQNLLLRFTSTSYLHKMYV